VGTDFSRRWAAMLGGRVLVDNVPLEDIPCRLATILKR